MLLMLRNLLFILLIIFTSAKAQAQSANSLYKEAKEYDGEGRMREAIKS